MTATAAADRDDLARALAQRISSVLGTGHEVGALRRLSAGASRETWSFVARPVDGGAERRLILRRDPPSEPRPDQMACEVIAWTAARRHGVPGPDIIDSAVDGTLGAPYLVVSHVDGETIPRRILRDARFAEARTGLIAQIGRAAAGIHAVRADAVATLPSPDFLDEHRERYRGTGVSRPVIDLALAWLADTRPPAPVRTTLVHGDLRLGNVIVGPEGLRAVLDWEFAHRGDPMRDLGWLGLRAWRFGGPQPVAGLGEFAELFDAYEQVAGVRPDPVLVRWWQIASTLSWAIGCLVQAGRHLSGATRSLELAAIGRRVAEQEHDLLRMIPDPSIGRWSR